MMRRLQVRLVLSAEGATVMPFVGPKYPIPKPLGCVVATERAMAALNLVGADLNEILDSHQRSHWRVGDVKKRPLSLEQELQPGRFLSSFLLGDQEQVLWVITDEVRRITKVLMYDEYQA